MKKVETGMIRASVGMVIPLERHSEALEILKSVCEETRFEPGCISVRLYLNVDDARAIMVEEFWWDNEAIMNHLASDRYRRILFVVEMAEEAPEIRFDRIVLSSGLELLQKARAQTEHLDNGN